MKPMSQILEERDPMVRIADALEEILRLVKEDQERSRKYMEESKDPFIKTMEEGEKDDNN